MTFRLPLARQNGSVHVTAASDYGIRALVALAASDEPKTAEVLAAEEELPRKYLSAILNDLRKWGLVVSQRGPSGGFKLGRPASAITLADVIRVLDGPLVDVCGQRPEDVDYDGSAQDLKQVWIAARASLRHVLEGVTVGDLATGRIPSSIKKRTADPTAWVARTAG